LQNMRLSSLST